MPKPQYMDHKLLACSSVSFVFQLKEITYASRRHKGAHYMS